jgi:hypothetical protein
MLPSSVGAQKVSLLCVETFQKDGMKIVPGVYREYSIAASNCQKKVILIVRSSTGFIPIDVTHQMAQGHFKI